MLHRTSSYPCNLRCNFKTLIYKFKFITTECLFPTNLSFGSTPLDFSDLSIFTQQWLHLPLSFLRFRWSIKCQLMLLIRIRWGARLLFVLGLLSMGFVVLIWINLGFLWAYLLDLPLQLMMHCSPITSLPPPSSSLVRSDSRI